MIQLIPEAKQAFYEDKLTVAHAFEIARLQPNDQRRALQECFPQYRNAAAILKDKKKILPCAAYLQGEYGIDGLYVGVPCKLGATGIEQIIQIKLTPEEQAALNKSAEAVRELCSVIGVA